MLKIYSFLGKLAYGIKYNCNQTLNWNCWFQEDSLGKNIQ